MSKYDFSAFENIKGTGRFVEFDGMIVGGMLTGYMLVGSSKVSLEEIFEAFPVWALNGIKNTVQVMIEGKSDDKDTIVEKLNIKINDTLSFNGENIWDDVVKGNFVYSHNLVYVEIPFEEFFGCLSRDKLYALENKIQDVRLFKYTNVSLSKEVFPK